MTPAHQPLRFWSSGGDCFWRGVYMPTEKMLEQAALALREHDACLRKGLRLDARVARTIFLEITDALAEQAKWKRAARVRANINSPQHGLWLAGWEPEEVA